MLKKGDTHTHVYTVPPLWKGPGWAGPPGIERWEKKKLQQKTSALFNIRLIWNLLVCPTQPSQGSSRLDEKHFYWALWEGQMPLCVCVFVGKSVNQRAMLAMSDETLLLSRLRWWNKKKANVALQRGKSSPLWWKHNILRVHFLHVTFPQRSSDIRATKMWILFHFVFTFPVQSSCYFKSMLLFCSKQSTCLIWCTKFCINAWNATPFFFNYVSKCSRFPTLRACLFWTFAIMHKKKHAIGHLADNRLLLFADGV